MKAEAEVVQCALRARMGEGQTWQRRRPRGTAKYWSTSKTHRTQGQPRRRKRHRPPPPERWLVMARIWMMSRCVSSEIRARTPEFGLPSRSATSGRDPENRHGEARNKVHHAPPNEGGGVAFENCAQTLSASIGAMSAKLGRQCRNLGPGGRGQTLLGDDAFNPMRALEELAYLRQRGASAGAKMLGSDFARQRVGVVDSPPHRRYHGLRHVARLIH